MKILAPITIWFLLFYFFGSIIIIAFILFLMGIVFIVMDLFRISMITKNDIFKLTEEEFQEELKVKFKYNIYKRRIYTKVYNDLKEHQNKKYVTNTTAECLEVFNLDSRTDRKQIKKAYKRLAKIYHPDLWVEDNKQFTEIKFKEINECKEKLLKEYK